jgi:AraC-like DNA-binding protein
MDAFALTEFESPTGHRFLHTSDVDLATDQVGRMYSPPAMRLLDNGADFACDVDTVRLGPVTVNHLGYSSPAVVSTAEPETYYAVSWPVAGRANIWQSDETTTGPDRAGVINTEGRVRLRWDEDLDLVSARIDSGALLDHLSRLLGSPAERQLRFEAPMELGGPAAAWVAALQLLQAIVDSPDDAAANPLVSAAAEEAVLTDLLYLQPNTYSRQLWSLPARPPARAVRRTMDLAEATPEWPHTPASLAAETGVSLPALLYAFHQLAETTPAGFLRQVRLSRAHHELAEADPTATTVPDIALRWGFDDPAGFAAEYRQRYDTSPAQTLQAE